MNALSQSIAGIPRVVIVGRPNVGKSTLFNALIGSRVAIEDPMAGVTRDRISFVLDVDNRSVELIDTGGIGMVDDTLLKQEIDEQIAMALDLAQLVLFVVDAKDGLNALDLDIARRLRKLSIPLILVANKVEGRADDQGVAQAHALGLGDPVCLSAKENVGVESLLDDVLERVGETAVIPMAPADVVRLAIVGRMNVGKSTLVNALVGDQRVIVSDVPGTTRDAVDVPFSVKGRRYVAIDTAGMRKRATISDSVEFFGQARSERAIRRADVVLLLLDATREVGRIDKQIGGMIGETSRPAIMVVTKWDLARGHADSAAYEDYLRNTIKALPNAPIAFISAPEGLNLVPTLELAAELHDQAGQRVGTGELNRALRKAYEARRPRPVQGRIGKLYYGSQVATHPPTVLLFVNDPSLFEDAWRRFLERRLQQELPFGEVPIRLRFSERAQPS